MEEKKETLQNNQEEIKLLTFQPDQMLKKIEKLKERTRVLKETISEYIIENNSLHMINIDLEMEVNRPLTWKEIGIEILLKIFGGQWE
jgi:hypothetical protein